ncbi:alkyl sulfatase dimerization domain-containing protein [Neobacillus drentensis]|uniref:alkyl sulfatase dimerization domain-containing protein n=1 Tax=Neobacillus drentensis TaxID=220684 RepID=UPI002FFFF537
MKMTNHQLINEEKVETKVGPNGEIGNSKLIDQSKVFEKRLIKITDGVYQFIGVGLANSTMIESENGIIIVDTGDAIEEAQEHLEAFRKITNKPIKAIIYTHWHYTMGTRAYVEKGQEDLIEIWGHELVDHNQSTSEQVELWPTTTKRGYIQFGLFLPPEGPDASTNMGIGAYLLDRKKGRTQEYIKPNHTVSQASRIVIDGINIELIPSISDTNDGLIVSLPDKGIVINNNMMGIFPNIGAMRGDYYRDPKAWLDGIKKIRDLQPTYLLGVHGNPIIGQKEALKVIEDYHDGIQFVYDQTVRGINLGLSQDELVEFVKLPDHLKSSPVLQDYYGEVAIAVRGIYCGLVGWYGNDTATIHPVTKKEEAEKIIALSGGVARVLESVQMELAQHNYKWAAQLSTYVLKVNPDDQEARQLKALALRKLSLKTTSAITRNFYLVQALELEGKLNTNKNLVSSPKLVKCAPEYMLQFFRVKVDPSKSHNINQLLGIALTETNESFGLQVRHGVAEVFKYNTVISSELSIQTTGKALADFVTGELTFKAAVELGSMKIISGKFEDIDHFFHMFDR